MRIAQGLLALAVAPGGRVPDFGRSNREDMQDYLVEKGAPKGVRAAISTLWNSAKPDEARAETLRCHRHWVRARAERAFQEAQNQLFVLDLYFSHAVVADRNRFIVACRLLEFHVRSGDKSQVIRRRCMNRLGRSNTSMT